jgi:N-methylhydantoinase B
VRRVDLFGIPAIPSETAGDLRPAVLLYREGEINDHIFDIVTFNSRLPSRTIGDQGRGVSRRHRRPSPPGAWRPTSGIVTVCTAMEAIDDHGERLMRARR